jgi:hypothetical protein
MIPISHDQVGLLSQCAGGQAQVYCSVYQHCKIVFLGTHHNQKLSFVVVFFFFLFVLTESYQSQTFFYRLVNS